MAEPSEQQQDPIQAIGNVVSKWASRVPKVGDKISEALKKLGEHTTHVKATLNCGPVEEGIEYWKHPNGDRELEETLGFGVSVESLQCGIKFTAKQKFKAPKRRRR